MVALNLVNSRLWRLVLPIIVYNNTQQTISKIKQSEIVEEETLGKIAKVLGVTTQSIKNFIEDAIINYFHDQSSFNFQCTFNPLDKVMELYERLLQAEREKNELLKGSK